MVVNSEIYLKIQKELRSREITLVAVSKTKPASTIMELYNLGHRDFGENYVQELIEKEAILPKDIRWHFIGHLQSNKVKYIAPFVHLIHGVDSLKLLKEIDKQAAKNSRIINCLLQIHIAQEETKFGLDEAELNAIFTLQMDILALSNIKICGLMGMASFSSNIEAVRKEFKKLEKIFRQVNDLQVAKNKFQILSMGMSSDYAIAIEEGSTLVRIGSLLFGKRD